jgi:formylglycine-generating enzyme required for sulfatase activity
MSTFNPPVVRSTGEAGYAPYQIKSREAAKARGERTGGGRTSPIYAAIPEGEIGSDASGGSSPAAATSDAAAGSTTTAPAREVAQPDGMTRIPGATTFVGSPRGQGVDDEWPRYQTPIASFCLDLTEVTAPEYARCVAAGKCTASRGDRVTCTSSRQIHEAQNLPMNCVDYHQAAAACAFRGARLPTEAEWEYAATGGDARRLVRSRDLRLSS